MGEWGGSARVVAAHEGARDEETGLGGIDVLSATSQGCRRSHLDWSERCKEHGAGTIWTADGSKSISKVDRPSGGGGDWGENDPDFREIWSVLLLDYLCA